MRPDRPSLSDEARILLRYATVADMKADAEELSQIIEAMQHPVPIMPDDPVERDIAHMVQILRERDRCRLLLARLAGEPEVA